MKTTVIAKEVMSDVKSILSSIGFSNEILDKFEPFLYIIIIFAIAFIVAEIIYIIGVIVLKRILKIKKYTFLSKLAEHKVLHKQAGIIPPLIVYTLLPLVFNDNSILSRSFKSIIWIYFIIMLTRAITAIISSIGETFFNTDKYRNRPIKGFIQVAKIIIYIIMVILIISTITHKSPLYLIGGLGAFAAVLMLVTKDSIMGFVGGFLLLENDMVRLGDWIELPKNAINGIVFDISLTVVKVRNFDNTIATIPPYTLINESFINWRGMQESNGRRIARGYTVNVNNIKPCDINLIEKVKNTSTTFAELLNKKIESESNIDIKTNAELFRMYAQNYLEQHPKLRKDMLIMVRTLEPNSNGLPIQFYCFTNTTDWVCYEQIQAEIMEHFAITMPLFELYPYQNTSARDTIISGMLEGNKPIEDIKGIPYEL